MAVSAQEMVDIYRQAEIDLLQGGKDVQINGRRVAYADLPQIRAGRVEWEQRAASQAGRPLYALATFG